MNSQLLDEIIQCLPEGRTHYRYHRGAYAVRLLQMLLPQSCSVKELKQSRLRQLLDNPLVKACLANSGSGELKMSELEYIWQEPSLAFLLSLSRWGGQQERSWYQTSRFGENLVLQLNLPLEHQRLYHRYINSDKDSSINYYRELHPVQKPQRNELFRETLAWARIDIDFETNEALIEEIQSDAARKAIRLQKYFQGCDCSACKYKLNYIYWMQAYVKLWPEAMLTASLEFIKNELGIERVFMHTARSGWKIKKMNKDWRAPDSLYSQLPKKFTFKQTWAAPEFLLKTKVYQKLIRRDPDIDFYQLSFGEYLH